MHPDNLPWLVYAELSSPIPLRGISPRPQTLSGKRIGIFINSKRAAKPIGAAIEKRLRMMYRDSEIIIFNSPIPNVTEMETKNRDKFIDWVSQFPVHCS